MNEPAYRLDIDGMGADEPADATGSALRGRPWIGIYFECCSVYARVYRNAAGTLYQGRCPRCQRSLSVPIGPGGTTDRFFKAE